MHRFPEQNFNFFSLTRLVQILFPYLRGDKMWVMMSLGQPQEKWEQGVWLETQVQACKPNQATVSSPREELLTARLAQFSEKDYSNSLRKSYMQSTDF